MESLYRKYRPLTFESVVGQQHIVSTLEHAITEGRLSHAYLFCGPRGTGKTTMARILAKALLCQKADEARERGASGCMPDGTCEECELIAEGNHPDVYELDAASRTGVDNVREEIINSVNFAPVRGKYKIYIIDEVHMLTTAAFNALLKTLEEPPAHVIFVLCTTDPQKILETILSRCQRFDFHRIGNEDIERRLAYVCEQEGFDYDDEALEIVARHARGGMRDALSTLEQLSVFGNGSVHADDARSLLGEVSGQILGDFARAIAGRDVVELFGLIRAQVEQGNDLLELTRDLVAHVRDVYMARVAGAAPELFEGGAEEAEALAAEAAAFGEHPADRLARALTVLDDAALEMRNASDARLVLEIACTRLARPESDLTLEALAERLDGLEAMIANGAVPAGVAAAAAGGSANAAATAQPTLMAGARAGAAAAGRGATFRQAGSSPTAAAGTAPRPAAGGAGSGLPWQRGSQAAASVAASAPASTTPASASSQPASSRSSAASHQNAPAESKSSAPAPAQTHGSAAKPAAEDMETRASTGAASGAAPGSGAATKPVAASGSTAAPKPQLTNAAKVAAAGAAETPAVTDAGELQRKWEDVVARVKKEQPSRAGLLLSGRAKADDGSQVTVEFPKGSEFATKMLARPDSQSLILPIVCAVFGRRTVAYVREGGSMPAPQHEEHSPAAPAAASAAPRPMSSAAPVSSVNRASSAVATSPSAATASNGVPLAPKTQPTPAANPSVSSAPAPARRPSSDLNKAPWLRSDNPAGAPATGHLPTEPAPRAPERNAAPARKSAAQAAPWESEHVPYDDAMVGGFAGEGDDLPPFDVPGAPTAPAASAPGQRDSAPSSGAPAGAAPTPVRHPQAASAANPSASAPAAPTAAPWESNPGAGSPFGHQGAAPRIPQTEEEAKALIRDVFGQATIFKPVE